MSWTVTYLPEAVKDFDALAGNQRLLVSKAIIKVSQNPLPDNEGGYGKPLGNKDSRDLTGFLKIKLRSTGLRIVYKLVKVKSEVLVVVIGVREDEEVYAAAKRRADKHGL